MNEYKEALDELLTEYIKGYGNQKVNLNQWTRTRIDIVKNYMQQTDEMFEELEYELKYEDSMYIIQISFKISNIIYFYCDIYANYFACFNSRNLN